MAWLPIFIDEQDKKTLLQWLNGQQDIAFIVSTGLKQWKAVSTVEDLPNGKYCLWHIPSGPLPRLVTEHAELWVQEDEEEPVLATTHSSRQKGFITAPWTGWTEECTGAEASIPYFSDHSGIIWMDIQTRHELYSEGHTVEGIFVKERSIYKENTIGRSGFNHGGDIRGVLPKQIRDWWASLEQWISAEATLLAHFPDQWDAGELIGAWSFYAFPSAYHAMKNGTEYYANGFDLPEGLR